MESSFFYFTEENGQIHKLSANESACKNSVNIGFSVRIDVDSGHWIVVPETAEGLPVSMLELKASSADDIPPVKYIYISSNVKYLDFEITEHNFLDGCAVEISPDNPYFRVYGNVIYSKDMTVLYYFLSPNREFIVPNTVKVIKKCAGSGLKSLKYLTVTPGVIDIEDNAFEGCSELENAEIHAKNIGKSAFENCPLLKKVKFRNTEIIGERAFKGCAKLKFAPCPNTIREIGDEAFALTSKFGIHLPEKLTKLGANVVSDAADPYGKVYVFMVSENNRILFPIGDLFRAVPQKADIQVRRNSDYAELYTIVSPGDFDELFTPFGVDDELYQNKFSKYANSLGDARDRLHDPSRLGLSGDVLELLKLHVSNMSALELMRIIDEDTYERLCEYPFFDDIKTERLINVSDYSAQKGKTETTAFLMQKLHERRIHENNE